ncbi:MAG TPA: septation protein A [Micropepsaceae bacterium]|jgi:intracellular septation protein|nr:septation protein A [Micropepsaceae bacterium]
MHPLLKLALDLGPLLVFFAANAMFGIFNATAIFMGTMLLVIAIGIAIERKVSPMPLITAVLVLVFGGLTIWLSNDVFIKIKPTILYVMFAGVLLGGLAFSRLFIKLMLGQTLRLPEDAWRTLTWRWALFFILLAVLNEIVWRNVSTNTWVAFKVWGVFPLTLLFAMAQAPFIARHQIETDETPAASR